jgi:hypothetical protein
MKRAWLGVADEIRDLGDRDLALGEVAQREAMSERCGAASACRSMTFNNIGSAAGTGRARAAGSSSIAFIGAPKLGPALATDDHDRCERELCGVTALHVGDAERVLDRSRVAPRAPARSARQGRRRSPDRSRSRAAARSPVLTLEWLDAAMPTSG